SLLEAEFAFGGLIIAAVIGRALMAVVMANLPHARLNGLSHSVGRPDFQSAYAGLALAVFIGAVFGGFSGVLACALAVLTAWACARIAIAKIGGQTGDILGATGQLSELAALMVLLACA
ncbi:MAG: adenosylcobinamide-GDP ribazoletransferase, partial [Marinovum sp.]|nr:adenosylcobinamide-GDP ribazoletransferase [Marinovum sp.]